MSKPQSDPVADRVLRMILLACAEGRLPPGRRTPFAVAPLADRLNIPRPSVRLAVRRLEAIGVLTWLPGHRPWTTPDCHAKAAEALEGLTPEQQEELQRQPALQWG
jgi:DNA-binding FadR family transcriptional regulator